MQHVTELEYWLNFKKSTWVKVKIMIQMDYQGYKSLQSYLR